MDNLEKVRERFNGDCFAMKNGARIEAVEDGYAKCSMELREIHYNAAGGVMGGAIFTLADFAFAVASNWNQGLHVTLSSNITFLSAVKGKKLIAEAFRIKEGRNTCYYEVKILDDLDKNIAHIVINGFSAG